MRIRVVSLGKIRQSFVRDGEEEFIKRIRSWLPIETLDIPVDKYATLPEAQLREKEGELFLRHLNGDEFVVMLDEHGKSKTSPELSTFIAQRMNSGDSTLVFAIGGAYGWSSEALKRAQLKLSLSPLTFTYQMCRLILIEQIYRALTMIKNVPYHK